MITALRGLANELRREATELEDFDLKHDDRVYDPPEGNDALAANTRREMAARLELILKTAMLEAFDAHTPEQQLRLDLPGLIATDQGDHIRLYTAHGPMRRLSVTEACALRDFLIAALAKHEDL